MPETSPAFLAAGCHAEMQETGGGRILEDRRWAIQRPQCACLGALTSQVRAQLPPARHRRAFLKPEQTSSAGNRAIKTVPPPLPTGTTFTMPSRVQNICIEE